jgi:hypothetical protein
MAASATRVGGGALAAMVALFLSNAPTRAGYIVTLEQVGATSSPQEAAQST